MERIKSILCAIGIIALFLLPGFKSHGAVVDEDPLPKIQTSGHTKDGKYPLYVLRGDVDGFMWWYGNHTYTLPQLYQAGVNPIDPKDINHPYHCVAICVDDKRRVVGVNPNYFYIRKNK